MDRAPAYAERFRCIGPACEDTCCQGWKIPVDGAALERYEGLPASSLKAQIVAGITPAKGPGGQSETAPASGAGGTEAVLRMRDDGHCTLLTAESLCSIHAQLGEEFLPAVCASYPRVQRQHGSLTETALALSCPEAARVVLLGPSLINFAPAPAEAVIEPPSDGPAYFAEIRATALALIGARNLTLWQRLFMLGLLCHRLDSIEAGQLRADIPEYLATFRAGAATGALVAQMESMPFDPQAQLDVILRLAGLMLHRSRVSPRFADCIAAFTAGIGNGPTANLGRLTGAYTAAYRQWFAPFERSHPDVLENYLINLVVLQRFPFGRAADSSNSAPAISGPRKGREFTRLIAQFALTRGLLIGVAGHHRERFSLDHVVHTVQTVSRHFDHHPDFLASAQGLLAESRLDGIAGLSILLRNVAPGQKQQTSVPIGVAVAGQSSAGTASRSDDRIPLDN